MLTRLFLRRFLDHDLISPDTDRHEVLIVICAALVSAGLFVTVMLAMKYQLLPFMSPGTTAVLSLDDRFLYIGGSMIVMALVAVAEWDALALDARDASILGPLPIPHRTIVRAKLASLAIFASGFIVALNLVPTVLRPLMLPARLPFEFPAVLLLVVVHAAATILAGVFGFLAVLAIRELLRAALGPSWFGRVSTLVQAALVVGLTMVLLLLPGQYAGVATRWLAPAVQMPASTQPSAAAAPARRKPVDPTSLAERTRAMRPAPVPPFAVPPLWFVGLHETLSGDAIVGLPRDGLPPWMLVDEKPAMALYISERPVFRRLARVSVVALVIGLVTAVGAYAWNSRRLPAPFVGRRSASRRSRLRAGVGSVLQRVVARHPVVQAGFFFTLQALSRSAPHRLSMATAVAVGLAGVTLSLRSVDATQPVEVSSMPLSWLIAQTLLVTTLVVGFRHAVRVPAELRANWTFHLAWSGDERPFLAGVKRAAIIALILPAVIASLLWQLLVLDIREALLHAAVGLLLGLGVLEMLLIGWRKLPFASSYVPTSVMKSLIPIYVVTFLLAAYALAWIERLALTSNVGALVFLATLGIVVASLRAIDVWQRRTRIPIELDELPAPATQRLNLSG